MYWDGWPMERILMLFTGVVFLVIFVQVSLFHYRQNFRHWSMWIPVLATPLFGVIALLYTAYYSEMLHVLLIALLWIGVLAGLFGTVMHIRGVGQRVDGYNLRNVLIGPPLALPALVSAMSVLGIIALYWG